MTPIQQPKRGEVARWMVGLMATAIVALFAALLRSYSVNADTISQKDAEIRHCQEERTKAEAAFRLEITALYKEVQAFREEIYRQAQAQQRQLKRIKK